MSIKREEIEEFAKNYKPLPKVGDEDLFGLAKCYIRLGDYRKGKELCERSFLAMLNPPKEWDKIAEPTYLVEASILSGKSNLYSTVVQELNTYKSTKPKIMGFSPLACSAYALMELLHPFGEDIANCIQIMSRRRSWKDMITAGRAIQTILDKDQHAFTSTLIDLLTAYDRQVKYGELRYAGLHFKVLSTYAMSIAFVAYKYGLNFDDIESEYFSPGYLNYLINLRP